MIDQELPKLKRHKKKLLGPFSYAFLSRPNFLSEVSWAETLFYESLWIGFLIEERDFDFAIRCGEMIGSIAKNTNLLEGKSDSGIPIYFWSHMKTVNFSDSALNKFCIKNEKLKAAREMINTQTAISNFPRSRSRLFGKLPQNNFFRRICNKEEPFALQTMFVGFVIDICSGKMNVPDEMLRQVKPESLVDYPESPVSRMTAGMLRSGVNAKAAYLTKMNHNIDTLPLWRAVSEMSDCE